VTIIAFFGGVALLYAGGELLVRAAAALGRRAKLSPLVAGLTLVACATSAPELAISLDAALSNLPGLAIGNVIGSNTCNLALILGLVALVRPASVRHTLARRDVLVMSVTTMLVPGLLLDGSLARHEGALLVLGFTAFIVLAVWQARATHRQRSVDEHRIPILTDKIWVNFVIAAAGILILVVGSRIFVAASVTIADFFGVPAAVVGLSVAAVGSSLPELTASIVSARHGQSEMAIGNLIGSNIFNLLLILGTTAVVQPLEMRAVTQIDLAVMIGVTMLALVLMLTRARLARIEGAILLAVYALYMAWLFAQ
jgi:cation:H+ antiporter